VEVHYVITGSRAGIKFTQVAILTDQRESWHNGDYVVPSVVVNFTLIDRKTPKIANFANETEGVLIVDNFTLPG